MCRPWPILAVALLLAGCSQPASAPVVQEPPKPISKDLGRLPAILAGIGKSRDVVLHEGLPSEFWEPEALERELARKKTVRLHGYPFYDERIALGPADAEPLTALFSARGSFQRFRTAKSCGSYHPDYCVEWKAGDASTLALICLECAEVQLFGPQSELHCDLSPEAAKKLKQCLAPYQKNRPTAVSGMLRDDGRDGLVAGLERRWGRRAEPWCRKGRGWHVWHAGQLV